MNAGLPLDPVGMSFTTWLGLLDVRRSRAANRRVDWGRASCLRSPRRGYVGRPASVPGLALAQAVYPRGLHGSESRSRKRNRSTSAQELEGLGAMEAPGFEAPGALDQIDHVEQRKDNDTRSSHSRKRLSMSRC